MIYCVIQRRCLFTNDILRVTEKTFVYLSELDSSTLTVREGVREADFHIDVNAYPVPQYYWSKGRVNITDKHTNIEHGLL